MKRRKLTKSILVGALGIPVASSDENTLYGELTNYENTGIKFSLPLDKALFPPDTHKHINSYLKLLEYYFIDSKRSIKFSEPPIDIYRKFGIDQSVLPKDCLEIQILEALADEEISYALEHHDLEGYLLKLKHMGIFVNPTPSKLSERLSEHLFKNKEQLQALMLEHSNMNPNISNQEIFDMVTKNKDQSVNLILVVAVAIANVAVIATLAVFVVVAVSIQIGTSVSFFGISAELQKNDSSGRLSQLFDPKFYEDRIKAAKIAGLYGNATIANKIILEMYAEEASAFADAIVKVGLVSAEHKDILVQSLSSELANIKSLP
ncbi:MAG: hypothetical protein L3J46_07690 [Kangiellaceae bacterium]|nr:hypothetical protein [Kangiellaceae bacterium]